MSLSRTHPLAWLVVGSWLLVCAVAFWYFQARWTGAYDDNQWFTFRTEGSPPPPPASAPSGQIVMAHFIDHRCPCTRFSLPHIGALEERYDPLVHSLRIDVSDAIAADFDWIPASPAVAIWDADGVLAYLGPYNSGVICGVGDDLVARVMAALAGGENPRWVNQEAVGCYCQWPLTHQ